MQTPAELFENTIAWLQSNYSSYHFYVERDIVWTVQTHIQQQITQQDLPCKIFNDYPILPGTNRSLSADLVILTTDHEIALAAEFKYEPSHSRTDIQKQKLPVVVWGADGVGKDIARIFEFVEKGKAKAAYSIFIDEGGYFHKRNPHERSRWIDWGNGVWILRSQAG